MLTNRPYILEDDVDFLHNYYERLVVQEVHDQSERVQEGDRDFLADVACVALNRLPPRYIRHDVDMTFFMSPQDMVEIAQKVSQAVTDALHYVESRERGEEARLPAVEVSLISSRGDKAEKVAPSKATKTKSEPTKAPAKTASKTKPTKKKSS